MQHIEIAKRLFLWNAQNLVAQTVLNKAELAIYFADSFQILANGRSYAANHENYFDFLNQFRSTIHTIRYELREFIADNASVAIPLTAHIIRTDGQREDFEAILILKFNQNNKIVLWHEVYIKLKSST